MVPSGPLPGTVYIARQAWRPGTLLIILLYLKYNFEYIKVLKHVCLSERPNLWSGGSTLSYLTTPNEDNAVHKTTITWL